MGNSISSNGGNGGGDDSTVAQTLASGSQDIAALAGLFATDGVERNALASETGYGTVISSTFSILGILGLVKSSIKLALGANKCRRSGWAVEPMRGIFGYENDETERAVGIGVLDVLLVSIEFKPDVVLITKKKQRFDTDKVPQLKIGEETLPTANTDAERFTIINLGNMVHDNMIFQHPSLIFLFAVLFSGATAWLILVVESYPIDAHYWVFHLATSCFHFSLVAMITPILYHSYLTTRPSQYLTPGVWDILTRRHDFNKDPCPPKIVFLRRKHDNGTQVLSFRGDFGDTQSPLFQAFMFATSALCVVGYVCQYTLLKMASDRASSIWIGVQAAFALLRALFWIFDPPFDDPKTMDVELLAFGNSFFEEFSLMTILTEFMDETPEQDPTVTSIPMWAFRYLQSNPVSKIIQECKSSTHLGGEDTKRGNSSHQSSLYERTSCDDLGDTYIPKASMTNLMFSGDDPLPEYQARFGCLDFRLILHRSAQHAPVQPFLIFRVEDCYQVDFSRSRSEEYIRWPSQTQLKEATPSSSDQPAWTRARARLKSLSNQHGSFINIVTWEDGREKTVPSDVVLDFSRFDFMAMEKEWRPQDVSVRLDLTNIPLPRSYALSLSFREHFKNNYSPEQWMADSLDDYQRTAEAVRKNKTFDPLSNKHEGERERRYNASFPEPDCLLDFAREYIGLNDEIPAIWLMLWLNRLHLPLYLARHKFRHNEELQSLSRHGVTFERKPTFTDEIGPRNLILNESDKERDSAQKLGESSIDAHSLEEGQSQK